MEKFIDQLNKAAQTINFPADRKRGMKHALIEFMAANPERPQSRLSGLATFLRRPLATTLVAVALVVLVGTGTALASQNAVPGDWLYPFKVQVAEKIEVAMAVSTEQQAETALTLNGRRLIEASALLNSDALNIELETVLENHMQRHEAKFNALLDKLIDEGKTELAADLSARYEAMLRGHQQVVANIQAARQNSNDAHKQLQENIDLDLQTAQSLRLKLETQSFGEENAEKERAAEGKINAAAHVLASAQKFVGDSGNRITAESKTAATAQLSAAEATLAKARTQFEAKEFKAAFNSASQALRIAQSARTMVNVTTRVNTRAEVRNDAEFFLNTTGEVKSESTTTPHDNGNSAPSRNNDNNSVPNLRLRLGL